MEDWARESSPTQECCTGNISRTSLDCSFYFYLYYNAPLEIRVIKVLKINKLTVYIFYI